MKNGKKQNVQGDPPSKKVKRPDTPLAPTPMVKWKDNIKNPANDEYVVEVAFNLNKSPKQVTQNEFNKRYGVKKDSIGMAPIKSKLKR